MDTRGESADFSEGGNSPGSHLQPNVCYENVVAVEGNHRGSQLQPKNPIVIPLELLGASPNSSLDRIPLRSFTLCTCGVVPQRRNPRNRSVWMENPTGAFGFAQPFTKKTPKKGVKKAPQKGSEWHQEPSGPVQISLGFLVGHFPILGSQGRKQLSPLNHFSI